MEGKKGVEGEKLNQQQLQQCGYVYVSIVCANDKDKQSGQANIVKQ